MIRFCLTLRGGKQIARTYLHSPREDDEFDNIDPPLATFHARHK